MGKSEFRQVRISRAFEQICDQINHQLASGELQPGDKLPPERDLALTFNVGRPAVREALRTLEISGIVSLHTGAKGGAFIQAGDPAMLTRSLQNLMLLGRVSVGDLAEARALISTVVIRLACERGTEDDYYAIEKNIQTIERIEDLASKIQAGVMFFHLIARATKNGVLVLLVDSLGDIIGHVRDRMNLPARPELSGVRYRILKAMRARDADLASEYMNRYMDLAHAGVDIASVNKAPTG